LAGARVPRMSRNTCLVSGDTEPLRCIARARPRSPMDGATRKNLLAVAEMAMRAWPECPRHRSIGGSPATDRMGMPCIAEILRPIWGRYRTIKYRRRRGKQAGARIGV